MRFSKPLIGILAETSYDAPHIYYRSGAKYSAAIAWAGGMPLLLPPMLSAGSAASDDAYNLCQSLDGLFLPGGYSNVERQRYGLPPAPPSEHEDPDRDESSHQLIHAALKAACPILAVCRGLQELNVALGGTLHPRLHEVDGHFDHREDNTQDLDTQYGLIHAVDVVEGGLLADITQTDSFMVNSLHTQAINTLAPRLQVEALADDGTVEAASLKDAPFFALGVQWHPEYKVADNPQSRLIFERFIAAAATNKNTKT